MVESQKTACVRNDKYVEEASDYLFGSVNKQQPQLFLYSIIALFWSNVISDVPKAITIIVDTNIYCGEN